MRTALVYPYITPKADQYRPALTRFCETFSKHFANSTTHDLVFLPCNGHIKHSGDSDLMESLVGEPGPTYFGDGWDIGAEQFAANTLDHELLVFCSANVYFHRPGALDRIVEVAGQCGPGLYGAMASFERSPHIRTCFWACNPKLLRDYPHVINSREKSFFFESGQWNFSAWVASLGLPVRMVTWDGDYGQSAWRNPDNIFRRGTQENCLVFDKHTDEYAQATPERKRELERYAGDK